MIDSVPREGITIQLLIRPLSKAILQRRWRAKEVLIRFDHALKSICNQQMDKYREVSKYGELEIE